MKNIFITGSSGFIGFHLANHFLKNGYNVIGLDNLNDYYDVQLKRDRTNILKNLRALLFIKKISLIKMLF